MVKQEKNHFLLKMSALSLDLAYAELGSAREGLTFEEANARLEEFGKNEVAREKPPAWYWMLLSNFKNPFTIVLIVIGVVSYFTQNIRAAVVLSLMLIISILMRFIQEYRSSRAAEALRVLVRIKATVRRQEKDEEGRLQKVKLELPIEELVPGDIVYLSAGDMVPADVRLIRSKDLFVSQSSLTGESIPVEKYDINSDMNSDSGDQEETRNPLEKNNLCFMGTSIVSGFGKALVIATGPKTYFGSLTASILGQRTETNFDKGINRVIWTLIKFIFAMIPIIFLVNGFDKGDWKDAFLFSLAVAVGLTPEMLPMMVTANLGKGAVAMSRLKVIVKRLNSIQSFGAMDILCTDKTGTLTQDKIILEQYLDTQGENSDRVLNFGYLNSYYQSGLKNMLDRAILEHTQVVHQLMDMTDFKKIDEIPFDFARKRVTVVLKKAFLNEHEEHLLICKGALEELLKICTKVEFNEQIFPKTEAESKRICELAYRLSGEGFRVIAVAYKNLNLREKTYSIQDESDFVFLGLMAFLDPPKETASEAIQTLKDQGITIKILTGDNDVVTRRVCQEVDLPFHKVLLGENLELMSDEQLQKAAEETNIFAKLTPLQKARIIRALQSKGHIVGFLGDGINDAPGLLDADVGISVDTATDIARESADIILLEKSLLVLGEAVLKGRQVYGNIIKYIKMATSSNFGNVLSVLIASIFLPFLPMLPLQILVQNLLYDFAQLSLPWDRMDAEFLRKPREWDPKGIARFMVFMGPISSIFDITTFLLLWFVFKANSVEHQALFQTGWFVEGLLSQTLIVHMIRTRKIPFFQSVAATPVILMTIVIMAIGIYLPFSEVGAWLQMQPLPAAYFPWLFVTLLSYCVLAQLVKGWYIKKFKTWL